MKNINLQIFVVVFLSYLIQNFCMLNSCFVFNRKNQLQVIIKNISWFLLIFKTSYSYCNYFGNHQYAFYFPQLVFFNKFFFLFKRFLFFKTSLISHNVSKSTLFFLLIRLTSDNNFTNSNNNTFFKNTKLIHNKYLNSCFKAYFPIVNSPLSNVFFLILTLVCNFWWQLNNQFYYISNNVLITSSWFLFLPLNYYFFQLTNC